jgi:hypothetical protein
MSDGYPWHSLGASEVEETFPFHAQRTAIAPPRRTFGAAPQDLAEWLPRLGPVLWLGDSHQRAARSGGRRMRSPMDSLSDYRALRACSRITPQGPREWLGFHNGNGDLEARLFLLPDSDLLAWDRMSETLHLGPVPLVEHEPPVHDTFLRRALSRSTRAWRARLLEFRMRRSPGPATLGAQPPLRISLLGLDIAQRIVHDENAEWEFPLFSIQGTACPR